MIGNVSDQSTEERMRIELDSSEQKEPIVVGKDSRELDSREGKFTQKLVEVLYETKQFELVIEHLKKISLEFPKSLPDRDLSSALRR
jgi:hypothetical protein